MESIYDELTASIKVIKTLIILIIKIGVTSYHEQSIDRSVILYVIEIAKRNNEKYKLEKRFSEFDNLHKNLSKLFGANNLPKLPGKTLLKLSKNDDLDKRREGLDSYMKTLVVRKEIFNSEPFKSFLNLDNIAPEITANPPALIFTMSGFSHGVRDFHYQKEKGLLFTLISDMNVASRVDSYLTNMKLPWEKDLPPVIVSVGAVECYLQENPNEYKFDRVWTKTFPCQVISTHWDQPSCTLSLGLDDGTVVCLKVSSELNYIKNDEIFNNKIHLSRVMGIVLDNLTNNIYTISEDKHFKIHDITKNETLSDLIVGNSGLTNMIFDKEYKRIFISNRSGNVFLYDVSSSIPSILHTLSTVGKGTIRGLEFDPFKNYIFTGGFDDGEICIFNIEKPGKEKFAKQAASFKGKPKIRYLRWSSSRNEIYVGNQDGTVTFWCATKAIPIYVLKAHESDITHMQWFEKDRILITSAKEKCIKIWKLPEEWRDKNLEREEERELEIRKETQNILNFQKKQQRAAEDSDEDELANWHKF